ncbi:MAG: membrane protein insertase YidC [Candidatus Omnitrophica bacterium]|nr:membrane protein insertase YidC [Candidatus Omnitrophota bacterium]
MDKKRLIIAVALSMLVIFAYRSYTTKFYPQATPTPQATQIVEGGVPGTLHQAATTIPTQVRKRIAQDEKTVAIENELYRAVLSDLGAGIKEFYLLKYKDMDGNPILLSSAEADQPLIYETSTTLADDTVSSADDRHAKWTLVEQSDDTVVYKKESINRIIMKRFTFHNTNYIIELQLTIINKQNEALEIGYKIVGGANLISKGSLDKRFLGADLQMGDKVIRRRPGKKRIMGGEIFYGSPDWISTKSRYFTFILKPEQMEKAAFIQGSGRKSVYSGVVLGPTRLDSRAQLEHNYVLYAGPNSPENITFLGPTAGNAINYGALTGIANILLKGLNFFYKLFGNYGLAIILLSVLISLILSPLTKKSLQSMKAMQTIQPEVEKIRKDLKDNPQKMNKEVMALYKEHKINPMGGCLPLFLQFPVFISLYQVLTRNVALKGAHFLWIKDLSEPDAAFTLPQTLPIIGNYINILPLLMVGAMVFQQKLSHPKGSEVSEQQKMMSTIFPIVFGFIFYQLPSGLVLYWLSNTLIMIFLQEVVLKSRKA